ncbi:hypothetical protein COCVIDRAFT_110105, partial [Bipolaris victoriae FI3]
GKEKRQEGYRWLQHICGAVGGSVYDVVPSMLGSRQGRFQFRERRMPRRKLLSMLSCTGSHWVLVAMPCPRL